MLFMNMPRNLTEWGQVAFVVAGLVGTAIVSYGVDPRELWSEVTGGSR